MKILVVEDCSAQRDLVGYFLEHLGQEAEYAVDGEDGLTRLEELETLDLLIVDVMMPRRDGIELLRATRQRFPQSAIVVMSALTEMWAIQNCQRFGANGYLMKPFDERLFRQVVLPWIARP